MRPLLYSVLESIVIMFYVVLAVILRTADIIGTWVINLLFKRWD